MTDEPILKTPGELLGEAREAAAWSLAEVAERTKIPVRQLEAIERDEYHRLSGPLYVKSFLRAYAEAVGVDVEMILDLYGRSAGEGAPAAGPGKADVWESETVTITRVGVDWGRLLAWGGGGAAVVVAIWLLVRLLSGGGGAAVPAAGPVRSPQPERVAAPADSAASPAGTGTAAIGADSLAGGGAGQAAVQAVVPPPPTQPRTQAPAAGLPSAPSGSGPLAFAGGGRWPVRVRLLTGTPLLAEVRCDGDSRFQAARFAADLKDAPALPPRAIEPGRAYAVREGLVVYWRAQDHCGLRLDRTTGVEISVNGEVRDISGLRPGQEIILDAHR